MVKTLLLLPKVLESLVVPKVASTRWTGKRDSLRTSLLGGGINEVFSYKSTWFARPKNVVVIIWRQSQEVVLIRDSDAQPTPFIADTVGTSSWCPYQRESVIAGFYFSQMSVICFCRGLSYCPFYRGVGYSGVVRKARVDCTCYAFVRDGTTAFLRYNPNQPKVELSSSSRLEGKSSTFCSSNCKTISAPHPQTPSLQPGANTTN